MVTPYSLCLTLSQVKGKQRRLLYEWNDIVATIGPRRDITVEVIATNANGIPTAYRVTYDLLSIHGITDAGEPLFTRGFTMDVTLPADYPQADAPPEFRFVTTSSTPWLPWHPNISHFGDMAGRVCINRLNTFTGLAWGIERVALYLRYELYHALPEPPYPEDLKVAEWVRKKGEPNEWIFFEQQ